MSDIPMVVRPEFGEDSFAVHVQSAKRSGVDLNILRLPGLGFDVDWPSDLIKLAAMPGESRTQQFVANLELTDRSYDGGTLVPLRDHRVRLGVVNCEH